MCEFVCDSMFRCNGMIEEEERKQASIYTCCYIYVRPVAVLSLKHPFHVQTEVLVMVLYRLFTEKIEWTELFAPSSLLWWNLEKKSGSILKETIFFSSICAVSFFSNQRKKTRNKTWGEDCSCYLFVNKFLLTQANRLLYTAYGWRISIFYVITQHFHILHF